MTDRRRLPVFQPESVVYDRRRALLLGGVALLAACSPPPGPNPDAGDDADVLPDVIDQDTPLEDDVPTSDGAEGGTTDGGGRCSGRNTFDVGAIEDFAVGSRTLFMEAAAILNRDAAGFWAVSMYCPHFSGLTVLRNGDQFTYCTQLPAGNHGSIFDADGNHVSGPASSAQINRPVNLCAGRVVIDSARTVPLGSRTPVPVTR